MTTDNEILVSFGAKTEPLKNDLSGLASSLQESIAKMENVFKQFAETSHTSTEKAKSGIKHVNEEASKLPLGLGRIQLFTEGVKHHFEGSISIIEKLRGAFVGVAAILAGGVIFKEAIDSTVELNKTVMSLSRTMGITTKEAGALNIALEDIGSSSEEYSSSFIHFNRQLKNNSEEMKKLGVNVDAWKKGQVSANELFQQSIASIGDYRAGIDQTQAAMTFFGRSVEGAMKLQMLSNTVIEEAKKKQEELGITVTAESAKMVIKYKMAMNDIRDVFEAVGNVVGQKLMPRLIIMAEWFSSIGPSVVKIMSEAMDVWNAAMDSSREIVLTLWDVVKSAFSAIGDAINAVFGTDGEGITALELIVNMFKVVHVAIIIFKTGFLQAIEVIKSTLAQTAGYLITFANVANRALHADFAGAKAAWREGMNNIEGVVSESTKRMKELGDKAAEDIQKAIMGVAKKEGDSGKVFGKHGNKTIDLKDKNSDSKEKSAMAGLELELERLKLINDKMNAEKGTFYAFGVQKEADYWKNVLATHSLSKEDRIAVEKKYIAATLELNKNKFEAQITGLAKELELNKNNFSEQYRIAAQITEMVKQKYGEQSKEFEVSKAKEIQIAKAWGDEIRNIAKLQRAGEAQALIERVDSKKQEADKDLALGKITKEQLLEQEKQFEEEKYNIKRNALIQEIELASQDPSQSKEALEKLNQDKLELERQYQLKRQEIIGQIQVEGNAPFKSMVDSWESSLQQMLTGQQTFAQAMNNIWKTMAADFIKEFVTKKLAALATSFVQETALYKALFVTKGVIEKAGAISTVTTKASEAGSVITANAAEAASGAASSQASIPYIGPILAIAAMAMMLSKVGSLKSQVKASAAGGYDIPAGINPIVQTHQREMILPEKHADVIRSLSEGGGVGGGVNLTIHAMDSKDVERLFRNNGEALAKAVKEQVRNFNMGFA